MFKNCGTENSSEKMEKEKNKEYAMEEKQSVLVKNTEVK